MFNQLQTELKMKYKKIQKIFKYKKQIEKVKDKLLQEKLKVKALSEELEDPKNIQRWRSIGETSFDVYELQTKIQKVQKKLIKQAERNIQQDLKISS